MNNSQMDYGAHMEHYLPEIFWHDRKALLSVTYRNVNDGNSDTYKIATTSVQREIRIWSINFEEVDNKKCSKGLAVNFIANLEGHQGPVNIARFSPSGDILASGDSEGLVIFWKISESIAPKQSDYSEDGLPPNTENWIRTKLSFRHDSDVCWLCWSPDSMQVATASNDESVAVYDVKEGCRAWTMRNFRSFPNGIVWDPRGKYLVCMSTDRKMDILDALRGMKLRTIAFAGFFPFRVCKTILDGVYKLFHDDQLMSFARVSDFSPDGELLVVPSGHLASGSSSLYCSYVFRRCDFLKDRPFAILPSKKPTFRVVFCQKRFELRDDVSENYTGIPYRVIWAILTKDSITLYDSQTVWPFAYIDNIHYNSLSDAVWSSDGKVLSISSLEGYCSFIRLDLHSIGEIFHEIISPPPSPVLIQSKTSKRSVKRHRRHNTGDEFRSSTEHDKTPRIDGLVNCEPIQPNLVDKSTSSNADVNVPRRNSLLNYFKRITDKEISAARVVADNTPKKKNVESDAYCDDILYEGRVFPGNAGKPELNMKKRVQLETIPTTRST